MHDGKHIYIAWRCPIWTEGLLVFFLFFFCLPYQANLIMTPNLFLDCKWYKSFSSLLTWYISLHSVFSSLFRLTVDWLPFLWAWGNMLGAVSGHLALHMLGQAFIKLPDYTDCQSTIMTCLNYWHGLTASLEMFIKSMLQQVSRSCDFFFISAFPASTWLMLCMTLLWP